MTFCPYDGNKLLLHRHTDPYLKTIIDNKYQIDSKIAEGGMGNVYRATHLQLSVPVAVKILHREYISDFTAIERFRREAQAAMQIRHTNAIAVMDFGVTPDGTVYLVMEYLEGCTLREKLKDVGHFTLAQTNKIIQQVCSAVNVAHKRKIIHRDLKPDNIFIEKDQETGEENIKVLDFGIAKLKDYKDRDSGSLTKQGTVVGTPHYMSPEQCYGREVDVRSDIYSIGIIVYEMLVGFPPFDAPTSVALAIKQASEMPMPLYEIDPSIPAVINAVVVHALEKRPEDRPQKVMDFAKEFEAALFAVSDPNDVFSDVEGIAAELLLADEPSVASYSFSEPPSEHSNVGSNLSAAAPSQDMVSERSALQPRDVYGSDEVTPQEEFSVPLVKLQVAESELGQSDVVTEQFSENLLVELPKEFQEVQKTDLDEKFNENSGPISSILKLINETYSTPRFSGGISRTGENQIPRESSGNKRSDSQNSSRQIGKSLLKAPEKYVTKPVKRRFLDTGDLPSREELLAKAQKPLQLPASKETSVYPVICEVCKTEFGRSIIPNSTIICPNCRKKMRR
ncbi:MAG: serine/threonine protein kinase [Blastocatellia bacterium]|nr:serine/threonine protein kinase [Blastocatellia bacterium]